MKEGKVRFVYSWPYDQRYRDSPRIQKILKSKGKTYPSEKKIKSYIKKIEKIWLRHEKKVLTELSRITGLKWDKEPIKCYVIGVGRPFSDPLTIRVCNNTDRFIDTLIHELIHQFFGQDVNKNKLDTYRKYVLKKYKGESKITRNHILLHSIYLQLYLKMFDKRRINIDIKKCQEILPEHSRSWDIVSEEDPENIIKKFRELTK